MFFRGIKQNPAVSVLIRSNHFGARFGAHIYANFSQVLREKL